jgi:uncharacterized protein GlcG (DUF336 family)
LYGLQNNFGGRMVKFGGGLPVRDHEGTLIGAIGVSGGSTKQDIACAEYAVNNFTQGS